MNIREINFSTWFDKQEGCWVAAACEDYTREPFSKALGDSPDEAVQSCVVAASVKMLREAERLLDLGSLAIRKEQSRAEAAEVEVAKLKQETILCCNCNDALDHTEDNFCEACSITFMAMLNALKAEAVNSELVFLHQTGELETSRARIAELDAAMSHISYLDPERAAILDAIEIATQALRGEVAG